MIVLEVAGGALVLGWIANKIFRSKNRNIPTLIVEPNVYSYHNIREFECPKCGLGWHYKKNYAPTYCECLDFYEGHFHMECSSESPNKKDGCRYRWIVLTKDAKIRK